MNMQSNRPQNQSCPAGGTDKRNQGQWGVRVAPPSGNTNHAEPFEILHKGFDTLTVAIKAGPPPDLIDYLETERAKAEVEQCDQPIDWNGLRLHLQSHGGKGYRYLANGGPFGASWAMKQATARDPWGLRVTFGSTFLATLGIRAAQTHLFDALDRMGIRTQPDDYSISRVDYCTDILAPGFALNPEAFVMHSSTNRRDHIAGMDRAVNGRSGRVTSITVGSTRARQVIIYDKGLEVTQKQKAHWWHIWNEGRRKRGLPDLEPEHCKRAIWRVEYRAGKDLLKDRWGIRTWEDLFARFGDLCRETGAAIRYTEPAISDQNRARWPNHPLWEIANAEIVSGLFTMCEGADPNPIKQVIRDQHISVILKGIRGNCITLAALEGIQFPQLSTFFHQTGQRLADDLAQNGEHLAKMLENARDRYEFVERERPPPER